MSGPSKGRKGRLSDPEPAHPSLFRVDRRPPPITATVVRDSRRDPEGHRAFVNGPLEQRG